MVLLVWCFMMQFCFRWFVQGVLADLLSQSSLFHGVGMGVYLALVGSWRVLGALSRCFCLICFRYYFLLGFYGAIICCAGCVKVFWRHGGASLSMLLSKGVLVLWWHAWVLLFVEKVLRFSQEVLTNTWGKWMSSEREVFGYLMICTWFKTWKRDLTYGVIFVGLSTGSRY